MVKYFLRCCFLYAIILWCTLFLLPGLVIAGNFKVSPVKIFLKVNEKTSFVRVTNLGDAEAMVQIHAVKWSQNEDGDESYEKTDEIVIFPKIASIKKDQERIIRLGYEGKDTHAVEESYRLIIEELPVKRSGEKVLKFVYKIRIPIFISPLKENSEKSIERVWMESTRMKVKVRNGGNHHFIVDKVRVEGRDSADVSTFSKDSKGWYVLAGASGIYSIELTEEECLKTKSVSVTVEVDGSSMTSHLDVVNEMCLQSETTKVKTGGGTG